MAQNVDIEWFCWLWDSYQASNHKLVIRTAYPAPVQNSIRNPHPRARKSLEKNTVPDGWGGGGGGGGWGMESYRSSC